MGFLSRHVRRHGRFYLSGALGIAAWFVMSGFGVGPRAAAAGDAFFAAYLLFTMAIGIRITPEGLRKRAAEDDEGIFIIILIALAAIGVSCFAILTVLHQKHGQQPIFLALALAGIPLGWGTLHTIAAFRYADLYYARKEHGPQSVRGLDFPHTKEPGVWEFFYYAFTVGTTAQTSDTDVCDTVMRRATLGHSIVSFFYNTAIIAMAINAVVSLAS